MFQELFRESSYRLKTYLDDIIVFLRPMDDVDATIRHLQARLSSVGLEINLAKSAVIAKSSVTVSAAIQVKRMDIVLGVPVGEGDGGAIVMEKLSLAADQIRKCASFHCRWVLMLNCFVPKLCFFLLSLAPSFRSSIDKKIDALQLQLLSEVCSAAPTSWLLSSAAQSFLPAARGGVGLIPSVLGDLFHSYAKGRFSESVRLFGSEIPSVKLKVFLQQAWNALTTSLCISPARLLALENAPTFFAEPPVLSNDQFSFAMAHRLGALSLPFSGLCKSLHV